MLPLALKRCLASVLLSLFGLVTSLAHAADTSSEGVEAIKGWTQGLRLVGNNLGFKLPNGSSAYWGSDVGLGVGLGGSVGLGVGYSLLIANRLDFFAGVGLSVNNSVGAGQGLSALNPTGQAYELTTQRGWRDTLGGLSLSPSASIGLVYRY